MNSVADQYVKESIQRYFTIFQTRWQVLRHALLVNGNGMFWNENGELVKMFDSEENSEEDYDLTYFRDACVKQEHDTMFGYDTEKDAAYKMHQMMIDFYTNNIDVIATTYSTSFFEPFMPTMTYSSIKGFVRSPEYSCIAQAVKMKEKNPLWVMEESWRKAVSEVISSVTQLIYKEHFMYMDDGTTDNEENWTDERAFKCYHKLIAWKAILCLDNNK